MDFFKKSSKQSTERADTARHQLASVASFLSGAAGAGAVALGFPMIAKGQTTPVSMRWQSTWPAKDIFHEYAQDFAKKVNDMTGGELKIEVLPAGAVVPAFGLLDAVTKGTLDGGHGVLVYHYGKQNALALWGSGPAFGMDANMLLSWHKYGGGRDLLAKLYNSINAGVVSFPYGPMPTQPLGWFKKPLTSNADFKGLKFRTVGISIDVFTGLGRCGQCVAWRRNRAGHGPWTARCRRIQQCELGSHSRLPGRLEGLHAAKLPPERRAVRDHVQQAEVRRAAGRKCRSIIENAVEAASADMSWKAIDRYSKDYIEMQTKQGVKFYRTPTAVLQQQLTAYDQRRRRNPPTTHCSRKSKHRSARLPSAWCAGTSIPTSTAAWRISITSDRRAARHRRRSKRKYCCDRTIRQRRMVLPFSS